MEFGVEYHGHMYVRDDGESFEACTKTWPLTSLVSDEIALEAPNFVCHFILFLFRNILFIYIQ